MLAIMMKIPNMAKLFIDKCPPLGTYPNKSLPLRQKLGCKSPRVGGGGVGKFLMQIPGVLSGMVMAEIDSSTISARNLNRSKYCTLSLCNIHFYFVIRYYHNVFDIFKMLSLFLLRIFILSFCYYPLLLIITQRTHLVQRLLMSRTENLLIG